MKTNILLVLLLGIFISCEKDYDLIADYCTFNSPNGTTCPLSGNGSTHNHEVEIEKQQQYEEALEIVSVKYSSEKAQMVFIFEFNYDIDVSSLFFSGTDLDNIIIRDKADQKRMVSVEVVDNIVTVKPAETFEDGMDYSVTLKESIRDM